MFATLQLQAVGNTWDLTSNTDAYQMVLEHLWTKQSETGHMHFSSASNRMQNEAVTKILCIKLDFLVCIFV